MKVNRQLSEQISRQLSLKVNATGGQSWHTASSALPYLAGASDVEGWGVSTDTFSVFEHGWLEFNGQIVDPTLWQSNLAYFPGPRFNAEEVRTILTTKPNLPLTHHDGAENINSPANSRNPVYWAAWEQAIHFAEAQKRGQLWGWWKKWWGLMSERFKILHP